MLQIEIEGRNSQELRFTLQGELVGEGAGALIRHWDEHAVMRKERVFIVDLCGVTAIDKAGETAVRYLASEGARFQVIGPMIGSIIDLVCEEKQRSLRSGRTGFTSIVFCSRP